MIGYQKTTSTGTDDCIIIDPRACYRRPAPVSADWSRVLIGAFFSLIGPDSENQDCANESIPYTDFRDQVSLGMASGAGAPGVDGHRFVGIGCAASGTRSAPYWDSASSTWRVLGNSVSFKTVISDGTSMSYGSSNPYLYSLHAAPSAESNFAAFLGVDITLSSTGATLKMAPSSASGQTGFTDTSPGALLNQMFTASYASSTLLAGGWWSSDGISGLTDFYLRFPHRNNRLRIHACRVEQLA